MATSGSSNFNVTRDEIITDALLLIRAIDANDILSDASDGDERGAVLTPSVAQLYTVERCYA